jgi:hypothetical protein
VRALSGASVGITLEKRPLDRKSFSVNLYYESRTVADLWGLSDFVRLFGDLPWIYVGIPRKRGVETRAFPGLRIQTWGTHSWCLIEMRATRPPPRRSIAPDRLVLGMPLPPTLIMLA